MRLPNAAHTSRPWRIHELTRDFRLEDVWALPTPGGPEDFPRLVQAIASGDVSRNPSWVARALWAMRRKLGELLGWDRPAAGIGSRVPTLRDRLPADLREAPSGPPARAVARAFWGALEGAVIALAGQAPHDELLAARAVAGVVGLDGPPALPHS